MIYDAYFESILGFFLTLATKCMLEKGNNYESEDYCRIALRDDVCIFFGLYGDVLQSGESRCQQKSINIVLSLKP